MIENFKYDHLIRTKAQLKPLAVYVEMGVYALRIGEEFIYVGKSKNVFMRVARFFATSLFTKTYCENKRLENYYKEIWVDPHPKLELYVRTIENESQLDDLETTWIVGLKPRFNGVKKTHMDTLRCEIKETNKVLKGV